MPFQEDPRIAWIEDMLAVLHRVDVALDEAHYFCQQQAPHRWIEQEVHRATIASAELKEILVAERWRGTKYSADQVQKGGR